MIGASIDVGVWGGSERRVDTSEPAANLSLGTRISFIRLAVAVIVEAIADLA